MLNLIQKTLFHATSGTVADFISEAPTLSMSMSGYSLELEKNSIKSRVCYYISKSLKYVRRNDLEGQNSNIVVVDLDEVVKSRLINVYSQFIILL